MKHGFFTDPHLGLQRASHTTMASRAALRQTLFNRAMKAIDTLELLDCTKIHCLGDVFDTFSNDEATLLQGHKLLQRCDSAIMGNHDMTNRVDSIGSLEYLAQTGTSCKIQRNITPQFPEFIVTPYPRVAMYTVPHQLTQELFVESVEKAIDAANARVIGVKVLLLHCNVGVPGYAQVQDQGTSLYLTDEQMERAVEAFDYVLVGHEHVPNAFRGGRVQILGNTFPLGFGEVADRFVWVYDDVENTLVPHKIFDKTAETDQFKVADILNTAGELVFTPETLMVEIVGEVKYEDKPDLDRAVQNIWKRNQHLLMVRNAATTVKEGAPVIQKGPEFRPKTLPEMVSEAIAETDHAEAYREALEAVGPLAK